MKRRQFIIAAGIVGLLASATPGFAAGPSVVVGGKDFTEQLILASITSQLLAKNGFTVDSKVDMGSSVVRQAMENGQIDVYWEYTGTSLLSYNKVKETLPPDETYKKVKELDAKKGIVWLEPSKADNTFVFMMTKENAAKHKLTSMSDMAKLITDGTTVTFACDPEFTQRVDGLKLVEKTYDYSFGRPNTKVMSSGLVYDAVKNGQVDVSLGFATDGRIPAFDLVALKDDKQVFASYILAPVVRQEVLDKNPQIGTLLNKVSALLDADVMARLNAEVDVDKKSVEATAQGFLASKGLI
ncbi:glycine betaine ABC transporter substrate-binding protein [Ancylobacter sp. A5.8]|uniref:glycine betaine ABC transporter substrate-binding protein n=1 Tax=Ancylobacter gelatini TaxID=2919920 RepID=UPI001F4D550D|nr:glycine betaine ABC transporter substrate-binding protein [Ancylobacter gelatini]MCJ8143916.1 glycine betaine ABC transporter substrate-binding protein [Ancylobacter gelatini]